jgi:hypothetical protein
LRQKNVGNDKVSNLLCRRLPAGNCSVTAAPADWKSAIQQVGNLRYDLRVPKYWVAHLGSFQNRILP